MDERSQRIASATRPAGPQDASPYQQLPDEAFWRTAVAETSPLDLRGIYTKKWPIPADARIATAGSCFAQHVSRHLKLHGLHVLDMEPAPETLPEALHKTFGYATYSARYGNIYTTQQLLQLAQEAAGEVSPQAIVWRKGERFYDALRPGVEPEGLASPEDVLAQRKHHLARVRQMFETMDVFIFTLGLTEAWMHTQTGTVYPTAPGTIAGAFDPAQFTFVNFGFNEVLGAFRQFQKLLRSLRPERSQPKILLTVSPVPLTATASGRHVLQATVYSKSVLRAVAGQLAERFDNIDYFPSYEIITNQAAHGRFYEPNLRSVTAEGVEAVMAAFFREHTVARSSAPPAATGRPAPAPPGRTRQGQGADEEDPQCEDALLEAFSHGGHRARPDAAKSMIRFVGNSHLAGLRQCIDHNAQLVDVHYDYDFVPLRWMGKEFRDLKSHACFSDVTIARQYEHLQQNLGLQPAERVVGGALCFVGWLFGNGLQRAHGKLHGRGLAQNEDDLLMRDLPLLRSLDSPEAAEVRKTYDTMFMRWRIFLEELKAGAPFSKILWIAAPDVTMACARFRFGDAFVDSGSQCLHLQLAERSFAGMFGDTEPSAWLIRHPRRYLTDLGFTKNRFASQPNDARDIHVSAKYYESALRQLLDLLARPDSGFGGPGPAACGCER